MSVSFTKELLKKIIIVQWSMQSLLCYKCSLEWDLHSFMARMNNLSQFKRKLLDVFGGPHTNNASVLFLQSPFHRALYNSCTIFCMMLCYLMPSHFTVHMIIQATTSHCQVFLQSSVLHSTVVLSISHSQTIQIISHSQYHNTAKRSPENGMSMLNGLSLTLLSHPVSFRWGKRLHGFLLF